MAIRFDTHGHNWKKLLQEQECFVALVTPAWHRDSLTQRQYAYAREIGVPISLLIQSGAALPRMQTTISGVSTVQSKKPQTSSNRLQRESCEP
jgi:hypothetical protein